MAQHYAGLLDGYVVDDIDRGLVPAMRTSLPVHTCNTVMRSLEDKIALAQECVRFVGSLGKR